MDERYIKELLCRVREGSVTVDYAVQTMKELDYSDLGYAKVDNHRALRNGYPEVIFCQGKQPDHIRGIVEKMLEHGDGTILATRANQAAYQAILEVAPRAEYHDPAHIVLIRRRPPEMCENTIMVVTGGTADVPVAEEAAVTAAALGNRVERLFDVGVAGLHRLLANVDKLRAAHVVIAVAGMEGALASVVGGLVDKPVIAVPTSIGYGTSFGGVSALLSMLNSCASGVSVVNIDNGFGAGYLASMINKL